MKQKTRLLLSVWAVMLVSTLGAFLACWYVIDAEIHMRYAGRMSVSGEKIAKTIRGMEMNAVNVFDEVGKHLDSPDAVVQALESKVHLGTDVRGYFAVFEPSYFPQKGRWFEPYVHQSDSAGFVMSQVGSARHDYTKSGWYVKAKESSESFWSDPYYYYDGTNISGHYCTFVKPVFDQDTDVAAGCYLSLGQWCVYLWGNDFLKSHPRVVAGIEFAL